MDLRRALTVALIFSSAACSTTPAPVHESPPVSRPHGSAVHDFNLPHRLIDGRTGDVTAEEDVYADLHDARVIYVSEVHNNPHHHAAQLALLTGLYARDSSVAIGLEMVKRPFQGAVDDYLAGKIETEELVARTEWKDRWGYSFELYRGIFEFARAHKLQVHALNAPDEITEAVASGGIESLSPAQKESLPDLDLTHKAHREVIKKVFGAHHHHQLGSFENFYAAQVIWDETMAYEIARALSAERAPKRMIVFAGDGHVRGEYAIPQRAARRGASPFRTVVPIMRAELRDALDAKAGDYLWVMAAKKEELP